jgi:hypothetical protein
MMAIRQETFEPEELALLGSVFDQTWATVGSRFESDFERRTDARIELGDLTNEQVMENAPDTLAGERAGASALADRRQDTAPDYQALRQQMLRGE